MPVLRRSDLIELDDYLATEANAPVKSEYLAGEEVYAMAGCPAVHNQLSLSFADLLLAQLIGKSCRTFISGMNVNQRFEAPKKSVCGLCKPHKRGWADKHRTADLRLAISHEQQLRDPRI